VHMDLPESLEAYYQEAGRAGRDGKRAYGVLLANRSDQMALKARYADSFPSIEEIKKVYHNLGNYFQLAYGAGEGLNLDFDLADYCKRFGIGVMKAMSALKFLEREGYITLSENVFLPSRLLFLVSHEDVYRFQIENAGYDRLLKTILRAYGGIFEQYAKIQEADIARKLALSFNEVVKQLNFLQEQGLLSYLPQTDQPQLQFVRPRVDLMHLDIDVKYVKLRKKILTDQINAILAYTASVVCRSKQLLAYFDEPDAEKCGVCDICLVEKKAEELDLVWDKIDFEIITLLQSQPYELQDLVLALKSGTETEKLSRISELLDAGKIKTDGKNYYL